MKKDDLIPVGRPSACMGQLPHKLYSYSEVSTFLDCQRKHDLRYRQRLTEIKPKEVLAIGSSVHAALEKSIKENRRDLKATMEERIATRTLDWLESRHQVEWISVEDKYTGCYAGVGIQARIDAVVRVDGQIYVLDWKTCKNLPSPSPLPSLQISVGIYLASKHLGIPLGEIGGAYCYTRVAEPTVKFGAKGNVLRTSNLDAATARLHDVYDPAKHTDWQRLDTQPYSEYTVLRIMETFQSAVAQIESDDRKATWNLRQNFMCSGCEFWPVCNSDLEGDDTESILKMFYRSYEKQ